MKKALALFPILAALAACQSNTPQPVEPPAGQKAGTFIFAPEVGRTYQHTMSRFEEVAIVGAPIRNSEEWEAQWEITIERETNLYLFRGKLSALKLTANGAEVLKGPEVKPYGAQLEVLLDEKGTVVDVRKTETITAALMEVIPGPSREAIAQMFSPQMFRVLYLTRANERTQDLIGNPAKIGSTWGGRSGPDENGPVTKAVKVEEEVPCGKSTCLRVSRTVAVDEDVVWESARARVEAHVKERGGNPAAVRLMAADIKVEDEFIVEPNTLQFFDATFHNKATLSVNTPDGDLSVAFTTRRGSSYKY